MIGLVHVSTLITLAVCSAFVIAVLVLAAFKKAV